MVIVQLDENKYFTGSYAKVGSIPNGVNVSDLPQDLSNYKTTCWKYDSYEVDVEVQVPVQGEPVRVPVMDEETGEQKIDESGELVFETVEGEITYETQIVKETRIGWIFDEEKYNRESELRNVEEIRRKREEAFELIDKYQLVLYYNSLQEEEKVALAEYRQSWLDAPETGVIPDKLVWMI